MALTLVTPPTAEPVDLVDARLHVRQTTADEDSLLSTLIAAARQYAETYTNRAFINQTWDWKLDGFPCGDGTLRLPLGNVTSITSITYTDTAGASQTWSSSLYLTDLPSGPKAQLGRITPAYAQYYPSTREQVNAVAVRFVAGYGAASTSVPESIKAAIKLLVGHWYANRESVVVSIGAGAVEVPHTVEALLWPYRAC